MRCVKPVVLAVIALSVGVGLGAETSQSRQAISVDETIRSLPTCEWDQVAPAENTLDASITRTHGDAAARNELELRLVAVLRPDATQAGVQVICKKLATIGSAKCVPALAKFLENEKLSHLARYALERIPDAVAADALRDALPQTQGQTKAGIISSIAARQDTKAVDAMVTLLDDRDGDVAGAALLALVEIGSPKAIDAVTSFQPHAPKVLEDQAKDACLRAAERLLQMGRQDAAAEVYGRLKTDPAEHVRAAALRGLVAARPDEASRLLMEALSGDSAILRGVAAEIIRDASDAQAAKCAEVLSRLPPLGQAALLDALRERAGDAVRAAALQGLRSKDADVQLAAIRALGPAGTAADVAALADLATNAKTDARRETALINLCRLRDKNADGAMVGLLAGSPSKLQITLMRCLTARESSVAVPTLLKVAKDGEGKVRIEAYNALKALADEHAAADLLALLLRPMPADECEAAIRAVAAACEKIGDPQHRADPLLAAVEGADVPTRCVLLRALGYVGGAQSLQTIHTARQDANAEVREAALTALTNWPDAAVVPELLAIARKTTNKSQRVQALRGLARIAPRPGQLPPQKAFAVLKEAMELANQPDDRRLILSRMAPVRVPDCLAYILSYLDDASLQGEAISATAKLAEGMKESHPKEARPALERVLRMTKDEQLRKHIERLLWNMKEKGN